MGQIYCKTLGIYGFDGAIHGMRAPMQSYAKSDSTIAADGSYKLGTADLGLAQRLINGGTEHRKFLRMIHVQAEFAMPRYWWSEYDTYKVATAADSESTMHKLLNNNNPITEDQFYHDSCETVKFELKRTIALLEEFRKGYKRIGGVYQFADKLDLLRQAKMLLPECFIQVRTVDLNYETIRSIYRQRKDHRLKVEWQNTFCKWVESLPYAEELLIS